MKNKEKTNIAIKKQSGFCGELMRRIILDIQNESYEYDYLNNYTRIQSDIVRLRRELNALNKMLEPYWTQKGR